MHPHDRDPDMAAATGIIVGLALGLPITFAIVAAVIAWGEPAVRYAVWSALVLAEVAR